jgi:hypothetical protein
MQEMRLEIGREILMLREEEERMKRRASEDTRK